MATVLCNNEISDSLNIEEVRESEVFYFSCFFLVDFRTFGLIAQLLREAAANGNVELASAKTFLTQY
jgi:hypothetical protein